VGLPAASERGRGLVRSSQIPAPHPTPPPPPRARARRAPPLPPAQEDARRLSVWPDPRSAREPDGGGGRGYGAVGAVPRPLQESVGPLYSRRRQPHANSLTCHMAGVGGAEIAALTNGP